MDKKSFSLLFIVLSVVLVFCFSFVQSASSADIPLKWDPSPNATSYEIQMSTDLGTTWSVPILVNDPNNPCQMVWHNAPDTGLLLFRCTAINLGGSATRYHAGVWYNGSWAPPQEPVGMGIL